MSSFPPCVLSQTMIIFLKKLNLIIYYFVDNKIDQDNFVESIYIYI